MKILFGFLLVICFLPIHSSAQYYLVLKKRNKTIELYEAGDYLEFKLKDERFYRKQMILGYSTDKIRFRFLDIALSEIDKVKVPGRTVQGLSQVSRLAITAGVLFLTLDQANQLFVQNEGLGPSEPTWLISGSFIGFGALIKLIQKRKFKLKRKKYRLITTDFSG